MIMASVVAGGDAGAELLAVVLLEVLFGCNKNVGGRVQTQELRSPLLGQVVGHNKEGFLAQAQALGLHRSPHHFKGLTRAHLVGQQRVTAVQHMGDGVFLVFPQGDGRVYTAKDDMAAVIFAGGGWRSFPRCTGAPAPAAAPGHAKSSRGKHPGWPAAFARPRVVSLAFSTRRSLPSASSTVS